VAVVLAPKVEVVLVQVALEIPTVIMVQQDLVVATPMAPEEQTAAVMPVVLMAV
jgi:hypothetical protein